MIDARQLKAIAMRHKGFSIKFIAKELGAAQSSVSVWTRSVKLSDAQTQALKTNTHTPEVVEKRRLSRLRSELAKRTIIIDQARGQITELSQQEMWLMATCLYWAEGSKTQSTVEFSNGDSKMIAFMLKFFRVACEVEEAKIRAIIHIHEHLDTPEAEQYWQGITNISKDRFYKTYNKPNRSSKNTRNSLPYGVCSIYVHDYRLLLKLKGWIQSISEVTEFKGHVKI